ncbi:hypothetical protein Droror1_Dr00016535 [Drosera rotundifolia]
MIMDPTCDDDEENKVLLLRRRTSSRVREPVSSELEDILTDTSLMTFKRLRWATWVELKILFRLAAPAVVVYLLNNVVSICLHKSFVVILGILNLLLLLLGTMASKSSLMVSCVRVSNELRAGHPKSASLAVVVATSSSFLIALILAILVLILRHVISCIFTGGTEVSDAVAELTPFLAASILLNGIQPVLSATAAKEGFPDSHPPSPAISRTRRRLSLAFPRRAALSTARSRPSRCLCSLRSVPPRTREEKQPVNL